MNYKRVQIGEITTLRQGFAINKNTKHHMSDEPTSLHLLRIGDMKDGTFSIFVKDTIPQHFIAINEDIIYTRTGQVGLVFRNQNGVVHNNCFTVSPLDDNELSRDFLYYVLQTKEFYDEANSKASGAAQPDLAHGSFKSIEIPLPPLKTQRRIASILSAYDDLIENNHKQIKLLEEAAQRLYKEWFVDLRFPNYENTPVVDGVPEGWEKIRVADLGIVITGKTPSTSKKEYYDGDIPFVTIPDMHNTVYPIHTERSLSNEGANSQKGKFIPVDSVMVSCIATVGLVNIALTECQTNQQINSIILKEKEMLYYTYYSMKRIKALLDGVGSNGATMTNVNKTKFESIEVVLPTKEIQKRFYDFCVPIFHSIKNLSFSIDNAKQARDRLLPKLMSGEVEV